MRLPHLHRPHLHLPHFGRPHLGKPSGQDIVILTVFAALAAILTLLVAVTISNPDYMAVEGYSYVPWVP